MARGIHSSTNVDYILESDRGVSEKEGRSIFNITPRTPRNEAESLKDYDKASPERRGSRQIDSKKWSSADTREFLRFVNWVDNFVFDPGFVQENSNVEAYLLKDGDGNFVETSDGGIRTAKIEDRNGLIYVLDSLQADDHKELVDASKSLTRLRDGELVKKGSNSVATSHRSEPVSA